MGAKLAQSMGFSQKYLALQLAWTQAGHLLSMVGENAIRELGFVVVV